MEARNNLGVALLSLGKIDEAILEHRRSLQYNPNNPVVFFNLANALIKKGEVGEAREWRRRPSGWIPISTRPAGPSAQLPMTNDQTTDY